MYVILFQKGSGVTAFFVEAFDRSKIRNNKKCLYIFFARVAVGGRKM